MLIMSFKLQKVISTKDCDTFLYTWLKKFIIAYNDVHWVESKSDQLLRR